MLDARIEVLMFKGITIALKYYENIASRPMGVIDILVRRESIPHAEKLLRECGYRYLCAEEKEFGCPLTRLHQPELQWF